MSRMCVIPFLCRARLRINAAVIRPTNCFNICMTFHSHFKRREKARVNMDLRAGVIGTKWNGTWYTFAEPRQQQEWVLWGSLSWWRGNRRDCRKGRSRPAYTAPTHWKQQNNLSGMAGSRAGCMIPGARENWGGYSVPSNHGLPRSKLTPWSKSFSTSWQSFRYARNSPHSLPWSQVSQQLDPNLQ